MKEIVYSNKLNKYFDFVEKIPVHIEKVILSSQRKLWFGLEFSKKMTFKLLELLFNTLLSSVQSMIDVSIEIYNQFVIQYYTLARYSTIPLNKIWILGWVRYIIGIQEHELLDEEGTHYITALPGGGKSSLMFAKMKDYADKTGKASYVTTRMEKVKKGRDGLFVNHRVFSPDEFWSGGRQVKAFNTDLFCAVVYDEVHFHNNHRRNREKAYNDIFLPMMNSNVLMRHEGIKWILYASQMPKNDIQMMALLKYYHRVKVHKGIDYRKWIQDGVFRITVLGWDIQSYTVEATENGFSLKKYKSWYKKNNDYLDDFDTFAMRDVNKNLPVDLDYISWRRKEKYGTIN